MIETEIEKHKNRIEGYQELQDQPDNTEENQISTSDPENRHMITRNNITEVAYNAQSSVDAKNKIPFDYKVTNTNDSKPKYGKGVQRGEYQEFPLSKSKQFHKTP